jgi:hypothetical protein
MIEYENSNIPKLLMRKAATEFCGHAIANVPSEMLG